MTPRILFVPFDFCSTSRGWNAERRRLHYDTVKNDVYKALRAGARITRRDNDVATAHQPVAHYPRYWFLDEIGVIGWIIAWTFDDDIPPDVMRQLWLKRHYVETTCERARAMVGEWW